MRNHPSGRVVATLHTDQGPVEVPVLSAEPRLLASGVSLVDGSLVFSDVAGVDDLAAYVWHATSPWRAAEVIPVIDGKAALPDHLIDRGDLRCQLFVDDPWVFLDPPAVPPPIAFTVEQSGWCDQGTQAEVQLARYIGTQGRCISER